MHEGRYQAQKGLMLRVQRPAGEKCADIDLGYMTARGRVRFMPDEYPLDLGVPA